MHNITGTQRIALISLIVALAAGAGYAVLYHRVNTLHGELDSILAEEAAREAQKKNREAMETLVQDTEQDRMELMSYLLSTDNPTPFLELLETLGAEAGVVLEVKSIADEQDGAKAKEDSQKEPSVRTVASVTGGWDGLYYLLAMIEAMPYRVRIENVAIDQKEEEGVVVWSGQIQLRVFTR